MIVWATTFSLLTLFVPKLHAFFVPDKESTNNLGKASDISGRQRNRGINTIGVSTGSDEDDDEDGDRFAPPNFSDNGELMSLNYIINNSQHPFNDSKVKLSNISTKGRIQGVMMEVHEVAISLPVFSAVCSNSYYVKLIPNFFLGSCTNTTIV